MEPSPKVEMRIQGKEFEESVKKMEAHPETYTYDYISCAKMMREYPWFISRFPWGVCPHCNSTLLIEYGFHIPVQDGTRVEYCVKCEVGCGWAEFKK